MKSDTVPHLLTTHESEETGSNTSEEISSRAYELYLERGQENGHDMEDWLRAEMEIATRKKRSAAA